MEFYGNSDKLELIRKSLLNDADIFTSPLLQQDTKSGLKVLRTFKKWQFYANFSQKSFQKLLEIVEIEIFCVKVTK